MKILFLLLLSFNVFASFIAVISPEKSEEAKMQIKAKNLNKLKEEIIQWASTQKYYKTEWSKTDVNSIASVEEDVITMVDDEEVISKVTMYLNPINFSITIEDKTAEEEAEETAKAERKAEMQELKTFITDVNESQLPVWHKKLLKVLIRELKD